MEMSLGPHLDMSDTVTKITSFKAALTDFFSHLTEQAVNTTLKHHVLKVFWLMR